jgi:hypothetical protein
VLTRWIERFEGNPGVDWVAAMYRRHRGSSAELVPASTAA